MKIGNAKERQEVSKMEEILCNGREREINVDGKLNLFETKTKQK